jgi:hypothetical protein
MDAKVTLSFDQAIIEQAKEFASHNNISLSRLIEFLLRKATGSSYQNLDELPVSDWVNMVAEGKAECIKKPKDRTSLKKEYYSSKGK